MKWGETRSSYLIFYGESLVIVSRCLSCWAEGILPYDDLWGLSSSDVWRIRFDSAPLRVERSESGSFHVFTLKICGFIWTVQDRCPAEWWSVLLRAVVRLSESEHAQWSCTYCICIHPVALISCEIIIWKCITFLVLSTGSLTQWHQWFYRTTLRTRPR